MNASLLIVDDDEQMRSTLARRFARQGMTVAEANSGEAGLAKAEHGRFDVALFDLHLPGIDGIELLERVKQLQPDIEVIMLTAHGSIDTAIQAMKRGAYDYVTKPFHLPELEIHLQKALEKSQLVRRSRQLVEQIRYDSPRYRLVGSSPGLKKVLQLIEKVAPTDTTVLIRGASGSGKELVARAIHANSPRRDHPLIAVNCATLQETLLESELFGHEKGSFTGATQAKPGLFEMSEGGTLLIDEIAEMSPGLQAKFLRVLEDGHFRRVGGTQELQANVRVIAATNKPLEQEIKTGRFRDDLYYRLNVFAISLPPLRDRREDIPELVEHFLSTRQVGPARARIEPDALEALKRHDWPGNVRELANVLERAQILAENHVITLDDLPDLVASGGPAPAVVASTDPRNLHDLEKRHVLEVLRQSGNNKVQAAKALGISRRALYRLLDHYKSENEAPEPAGAATTG